MQPETMTPQDKLLRLADEIDAHVAGDWSHRIRACVAALDEQAMDAERYRKLRMTSGQDLTSKEPIGIEITYWKQSGNGRVLSGIELDNAIDAMREKT